MNKAFTLLELVVVIIILGVLATLGITQYGRMVEKGRWAEAYQILGDMRKLAIAYRLQNGTIQGILPADVNVGYGPDQIPYYLSSSHYFFYDIPSAIDPVITFRATRCTRDCKEPQGARPFTITLTVDLVTGADTWGEGVAW